MQTICQVRPRPEEFLGPFFPVTAGTLVTSPQRHGGAGHHGASRASRGFTGPHGGAGHHGASWRRSASLGSPDLATRTTSATALATALATGFSSNSYVFL